MTTQLTIGDALAEEGMARATGERFSANTIRPQLPEGIRPAAVGGRFRYAARKDLIRPVDYTPSTDARTHGHPVRVWQGRAA